MDLQLAGFRFDELTVPKDYLFYIEMAGLANGTRGSKSGDILILYVRIGLLILIFFPPYNSLTNKSEAANTSIESFVQPTQTLNIASLSGQSDLA